MTAAERHAAYREKRAAWGRQTFEIVEPPGHELMPIFRNNPNRKKRAPVEPETAAEPTTLDLLVASVAMPHGRAGGQ